MALFHAENVVKSEFALPAFQQEAVDIEQEYDGKDRDDQLSYAHICPDDVAAPQLGQTAVVSERAYYVIYSRRERAGDHVRQIYPAVFDDVAERHAGVDSSHCDHRLSP